MGSATAAAGRSRSVNELVIKHWKEVVQHQSPAERKKWLRTPEAIAALGAKQCAKMLRSLGEMLTWLGEMVPGPAWIEEAFDRGRPFPPPIEEKDEQAGGRRGPGAFGRGMVYATCHVRLGEGGLPTCRLTPRPAVGVEDLLDGMSDVEAYFYEFPPSPSAQVIRRVAECQGVESGGR